MTDGDLFEQELQRVDDFVGKLGEIVSEDGKITKEERLLINSILDNLKEYRHLIMDVTLDENISGEEQVRMTEFRQGIVDAAKKIALEDDKYTEDEWKVIEGLQSFVVDPSGST